MARPRRVDQLAVTTDLYCDEQVVHVEAVRTARASLPVGQIFAEMAGLFSALGDPTRLRLAVALAHGPLCVCDLAATVGLSESAVSHHLRLLRSLGLVRTSREGRLVYYLLDDDHVRTLIRQARNHAEHQEKDTHS